MIDHVFVGASPSDEECAQVGSEGFEQRARIEMAAFIAQLRRVFGPEPDGARLCVQWSPHDFGRYGEVVCSYDDTKPASEAYAFRCEAETPVRWDDAAKHELWRHGLRSNPV